ncbi:RNA-directed DNA polymerase [Operophtera brumata]|uniref:RNA-directed DNA polymerase n=1 Tax=Operophtera brumata TaxID=104452 RepID=A0A0L7LS93_OPEBR|nr:RNA-directed DNA polymerase [Operophtera brumata]
MRVRIVTSWPTARLRYTCTRLQGEGQQDSQYKTVQLKKYKSVIETSDCVELLQDIDSLDRWSRSNRLAFNVTKCKVMSFPRLRDPNTQNYSLGAAIMERVDSIRYLGLVEDSCLDFRQHIMSMCKKANTTL